MDPIGSGHAPRGGREREGHAAVPREGLRGVPLRPSLGDYPSLRPYTLCVTVPRINLPPGSGDLSEPFGDLSPRPGDLSERSGDLSAGSADLSPGWIYLPEPSIYIWERLPTVNPGATNAPAKGEIRGQKPLFDTPVRFSSCLPTPPRLVVVKNAFRDSLPSRPPSPFRIAVGFLPIPIPTRLAGIHPGRSAAGADVARNVPGIKKIRDMPGGMSRHVEKR